MPTLTAKSIWKLRLLAEKKACKKDNPELRYLINNKFGDINMGYKYRVRPSEDGNYPIVELNYIGNDVKADINIDKIIFYIYQKYFSISIFYLVSNTQYSSK